MLKLMIFIPLAICFLTSTLRADDLSNIVGVWKIPDEYDSRVTYYFQVTKGEAMVNGKLTVVAKTKLIYPKPEDIGPVPHANNYFTVDKDGNFVLSNTIRMPQTDDKGKATGVKPERIFKNLSIQNGTNGVPSPGFVDLDAHGLPYKLVDGNLVPDFSRPALRDDPNPSHWLPTIVRIKDIPGGMTIDQQIAATKAKADSFTKFADQNFKVSFPEHDDACPTGFKPFLPFSTDAYNALTKIGEFHPDSPTSDDWAKISEGDVAVTGDAKANVDPQYYLHVDVNGTEQSMVMTFSKTKKGDPKDLLPFLKLTQVGDSDQWVIPNRDPKTQELHCKWVTMTPTDSKKAGGQTTGAPQSGTGTR